MRKHTVDYPVHPLGSQARVLLLSVFGPYAQDDQYGSRLINPMELLPQPGDAGAACLLVSLLLSILGADAHPGEPEGPLHAPGLSLGGKVRRGDQDQKIRRHRDQFHHSQSAQGAEDVSADPEASARGDHRRRRTYRQCSRFEEVGRCRPRRQGRRRSMDARVSRRRRESADPASADHFRRFPAHHGRAASQPPRHRRCHVDPVRGMSHGLQLLLHLGHVRRQGKVHRVLQDRRRTLRNHVCVGVGPARPRLLRHGRELPAEPEAGAPAAGLDGEARQVVESESLQFRQRAAAIHDGTTGRAWESTGCGLAWRARIPGTASWPERIRWRWSASLQSHGIRVLGSSIIGIEEHTPENIDEVIDYAVGHNTDLHQFMLYTPIPGTPLYAEQRRKARCSVLPSCRRGIFTDS